MKATSAASPNMSDAGSHQPLVPPSQAKDSGSPNTGMAPEMIRASPRAAIIMPSVTINGGIRPLAVSMPLTKPQPRPTPVPSRMPGMTGRPKFTMAMQPATPPSAATLPTDRSIPAVRITTNWPSDRIPTTAVRCITFWRFSEDRNSSDASASTTHNAARMKIGECFAMKLPMSLDYPRG